MCKALYKRMSPDSVRGGRQRSIFPVRHSLTYYSCNGPERLHPQLRRGEITSVAYAIQRTYSVITIGKDCILKIFGHLNQVSVRQ